MRFKILEQAELELDDAYDYYEYELDSKIEEEILSNSLGALCFTQPTQLLRNQRCLKKMKLIND